MTGVTIVLFVLFDVIFVIVVTITSEGIIIHNNVELTGLESDSLMGGTIMTVSSPITPSSMHSPTCRTLTPALAALQ